MPISLLWSSKYSIRSQARSVNHKQGGCEVNASLITQVSPQSEQVTLLLCHWMQFLFGISLNKWNMVAPLNVIPENRGALQMNHYSWWYWIVCYEPLFEEGMNKDWHLAQLSIPGCSTSLYLNLLKDVSDIPQSYPTQVLCNHCDEFLVITTEFNCAAFCASALRFALHFSCWHFFFLEKFL